MNAAIAGISCGLMKLHLAYYCRLSRKLRCYVELNRVQRAISRKFVFVIDVQCRTAIRLGVKATPGIQFVAIPYIINRARESKRNVSYVTVDVFFGRATCFRRVPG